MNERLTPDEVREARQTLGLSLTELAILLGLANHDPRTVRSWETGRREISGPCSAAIRLAVENHHLRNKGRRAAPVAKAPVSS